MAALCQISDNVAPHVTCAREALDLNVALPQFHPHARELFQFVVGQTKNQSFWRNTRHFYWGDERRRRRNTAFGGIADMAGLAGDTVANDPEPTINILIAVGARLQRPKHRRNRWAPRQRERSRNADRV